MTVSVENRQIRFAIRECSLGAILVALSNQGVCAISLGDEPEILVQDLRHRFIATESPDDDTELDRLVAEVINFVDTPSLELNLPLDLRGTNFQQRVWQALREIPAGTTSSYSEIAKQIGSPRAVRAVAGACAANPLAVIIPCHRVVRKDGTLSGYHWGVDIKAELLRREGLSLHQ